MVRKITFAVSLVMSLLVARDASATPIEITPVDLDSWVGGSIVRSHTALFKTQPDTPPFTTGEIGSDVFFDGFDEYTYVHRLISYGDVYSSGVTRVATFGPALRIRGFNGIAGWSFSDALRAGGTGTDSDFRIIGEIGTGLYWDTRLEFWDPFEPIRFFFVSAVTMSCPSIDPHCSVRTGPYVLSSHDFGGGQASSLAPVPEPGTIALFGSGLVGLYAAMRRRRSPKQ